MSVSYQRCCRASSKISQRMREHSLSPTIGVRPLLGKSDRLSLEGTQKNFTEETGERSLSQTRVTRPCTSGARELPFLRLARALMLSTKTTT